MIGYPSGRDGAILPARDYPPYPARKFPRKPYNKSSNDQACLVKMAGYWPNSFFFFFACLWSLTLSRSINTPKKELGQYPAILTSRLVNDPYIFSHYFCIFIAFFCRTLLSRAPGSGEWVTTLCVMTLNTLLL